MSAPFPTPVQDPAYLAAFNVITTGNQLFRQMLNQYMQAYNMVWANPTAPPNLIVAALGVNAQKVFALSAGLAAATG